MIVNESQHSLSVYSAQMCTKCSSALAHVILRDTEIREAR